MQLWLLFFISDVMMIVAMLTAVLLLNNASRLRKVGYTEPLIELTLKQSRKMLPWLILSILIPQLITIFIISRKMALTADHFMYYALPATFLGLLPTAILIEGRQKKEFRRVAKETGCVVVYDINYKIIHQFFMPRVELIQGAIILLLGLGFLSFQSAWTIYLYMILFAFLYFTWRESNYMTKETFRNNYQIMAGILIGLNCVYILLLISAPLEFLMEKSEGITGWLMVGLIVLSQIVKTLFYIKRYKSFTKLLPA